MRKNEREKGLKKKTLDRFLSSFFCTSFPSDQNINIFDVEPETWPHFSRVIVPGKPLRPDSRALLGFGFSLDLHATDGHHLGCLEKKNLNIYFIAEIPPGKKTLSSSPVCVFYRVSKGGEKKLKSQLESFLLGILLHSWEGPPNSPATSTLIIATLSHGVLELVHHLGQHLVLALERLVRCLACLELLGDILELE